MGTSLNSSGNNEIDNMPLPIVLPELEVRIHAKSVKEVKVPESIRQFIEAGIRREIEKTIADWGAYYGMSRSVEMMSDEDYIDPFEGCSNPNCTRQLDCDFCAEYWHDYYFIGPKLPEAL